MKLTGNPKVHWESDICNGMSSEVIVSPMWPLSLLTLSRCPLVQNSSLLLEAYPQQLCLKPRCAWSSIEENWCRPQSEYRHGVSIESALNLHGSTRHWCIRALQHRCTIELRRGGVIGITEARGTVGSLVITGSGRNDDMMKKEIYWVEGPWGRSGSPLLGR